MKIKKFSLVFLLIIITIFLGYYRDSLFININYQLSYLSNTIGENYLTDNFKFLSDYTYTQLYYGKWLLTIVFSLFYYLLTIVTIYTISKNKNIIKWTSYAYLSLFTISAIAYALGIVFNNIETGYKFSRIFMGLLQSPIVLIILLPLYFLNKTEKSNS